MVGTFLIHPGLTELNFFYRPRVIENAFHFQLGHFPHPVATTLVITQLRDGDVAQEISRPLPADLGEVGIYHGGVPFEQWLGLPKAQWTYQTTYHTLGTGLPLLSLGGGTNAVRVRVLDGATTLLDETYPI